MLKQLMSRLAILYMMFMHWNGVFAQIEKGDLIKEKLVSSEIAPSETHVFHVLLKENQYAFFRLMQKGVDLKVTTFDMNGEKIAEFDSPNGKNGPELFSITTSSKGKFSIEIAPLDSRQSAGSYDVELEWIKSRAISPLERVDELFAPWDNERTPGAAVAIVKDGKLLYSNGYGLANLEYDVPITPSSIFHVASVSKQFTVFSILLLEKQGKLSLDDDIRTYIPEVPDFGQTITLRHLASHTSGLRDQWELLSMAGWRMDDVITTEHILKLVSQQQELNFNPGEKFTYCNTGFTLLAEVVARISEMSFADFTRKNIFEPLKMTHSLFYDAHEKIVKNRAYSYYSAGQVYKKGVLNYANVGATSLFTTVEDLSLWALNFDNPIVGDSSIIGKMNTRAVLNDGTTFGGALGQFVRNYGGLTEYFHSGVDAGYRTFLARFPDQDFSVIVLSNLAEIDVNFIVHSIVDIYLNDEFKAVETDPALESIVIEPKVLKTYLGDFELKPGFIITITENNGMLVAKATGQSELELVPLSMNEFEISKIDAILEFIPNEGNSVELFKLHQGGEITDVLRRKPFDPSAVHLTDYEGEFYSEELSTTYQLVAEENSIMIKHIRLGEVALYPVNQDLFSDDGWLFEQVEFIRDEERKIIGFRVSNSRARNIFFGKVL